MATTPVDASPLDGHAPPTADTRRRSGRAIAALILGILSLLTVLLFLPSIVLAVIAIVLGATARSDAKRKDELGVGQATAGIVLGALSLVGTIGILVLAASS